QRARAVANPALGKNTHQASVFQSLDRGANCFEISAVPLCWERVNQAQEEAQRRRVKEFGHGHPINLAPHRPPYHKWIEMTDMIRCQQKSNGPICIPAPDYADPRNTAKHESDQQLASLIKARFHFCPRSVSHPSCNLKLIFSC